MDDLKKIAAMPGQITGIMRLTDPYNRYQSSFVTIPISRELTDSLIINRQRVIEWFISCPLLNDNISHFNRSRCPQKPAFIPRDKHQMASKFSSYHINVWSVIVGDVDGTLAFYDINNNGDGFRRRLHSGCFRKGSPFYIFTIVTV